MKLNKKKELYVNAIIGGNAVSQKQGEKMVKAGLMSVSYKGSDFNIHDWIRGALTAEPLRDLKLLYTVLNG
jgi:hypothetical protein